MTELVISPRANTGGPPFSLLKESMMGKKIIITGSYGYHHP